MGYVLLIRDENGQVSWINKVFSEPEQAWEFAKIHGYGQNQIEIVSYEEFQAWISNNRRQEQHSGYQQRVSTISDEREPEPRSRPVMTTFKPVMFRPSFVGRRVRR